MNIYNNSFINPKSSMDKDYSYKYFNDSIGCNCSFYSGEDKADSVVLET